MLQWHPERLNAAIQRAYAESLRVAEADAKSHSPSSKAGVELRGTSLVPTGLGTVFERGRRGGYIIQPKGKVLSGGLEHPISVPLKGGPMQAEPFIFPAAVRWAKGGFHAVARAVLMGSGFR